MEVYLDINVVKNECIFFFVVCFRFALGSSVCGCLWNCGRGFDRIANIVWWKDCWRSVWDTKRENLLFSPPFIANTKRRECNVYLRSTFVLFRIGKQNRSSASRVVETHPSIKRDFSLFFCASQTWTWRCEAIWFSLWKCETAAHKLCLGRRNRVGLKV